MFKTLHPLLIPLWSGSWSVFWLSLFQFSLLPQFFNSSRVYCVVVWLKRAYGSTTEVILHRSTAEVMWRRKRDMGGNSW